MAKDSNNTKLWIGSGLRISEINDVLGESTGDLGTLCKSSNINPWAKYKPFKHSSRGYSNASEWLSAISSQTVRYGFGRTEVTLAYTGNGASTELKTYYHNNGKPTGSSNSEPYRQLDFADLTTSSTYGYNSNAVAPIATSFDDGGTDLNQGNSGVELRFDSNANLAWDSNTCVSFNNIYPASLSTYRFAVLLKSATSNTNTLIVSSKGPADVPQSSAIYIPFSGVESSDHIYVPRIGYEDQNRVFSDGDSVVVKVGLVNADGWNPSPSDVNQWGYVYTFNPDPQGSPYQFSGQLCSLNFENNIDAKTLRFTETNSIKGITGSISASISRATSSYRPDSNTYYTCLINSITVNLDTSACSSWGSLTGARVQLFITFPIEPVSASGVESYYIHSSQNSYDATNDIQMMAIGDITSWSPTNYAEYFADPTDSHNGESYRITNSESGAGGKDIAVSIGFNQQRGKTLSGVNIEKPYISYTKNNSSASHSITIHGFAYMGDVDSSTNYKVMLEPITINMDTLT